MSWGRFVAALLARSETGQSVGVSLYNSTGPA